MLDDDDRCARCGRELDQDPDEGDPTEDDNEPLCDLCRRDRERERDQERYDDFVLIDLLDGVLDGHLDEA